MQQTKTEIIAVGTELLLGQIANTNAQWLSERLSSSGVDVLYHSVVGDNLERVKQTFHQAENRSHIIIVTGGLGPTDDDLTREAFEELSDQKLVMHEETLNKVTDFFVKQNREMTINNRKQALVFEDAIVISNSAGMAPGMIVNHNGRIWIFLPGVPKEMKVLFLDGVLPYLRSLNGETIIKSKVLRFIGIGEAELEDTLYNILANQSNPTIAPLAQADGVILRLTAKAESEAIADTLLTETKNEILEKVSEYFYGIDDESIYEHVFTQLKENQQTIAAAESLTGGLFTDRLISIPGSSEVCYGGIVCYDTSVKEKVLGVRSDTLKKEGTVSVHCAKEMAEQVRSLLNTNIGISFTGVAGPGEVEGHPAGTVYIGIAIENQETFVQKFNFIGNRQSVRNQTVLKGYELLFKFL